MHRILGEELLAYHSWLHGPDGFVLRIMGNIRGAVEEIIDAMAGICTDNSTTV